MLKGKRAAAWAAAAAIHLWAGLSVPIGAFNDDALNILLSLSLRRGAYELPGSGLPALEPLPGFAALLALPAWLVEPRWGLLRLAGWASSALLVWATWRLARTVLDEDWALLAGLAAALNPALLIHAGAVLPDIPFAALAALTLLGLHEARTLRGTAWTAAAAGAACLFRPQGVFLVFAAGAALGWREGGKRGASFTAAALVPFAAWAARNRLAGGTASGYFESWRAQLAGVWELGDQARHAGDLAAHWFGGGSLPAGLVVLALLALGARRLLESDARVWVFAGIVFAAETAALHMTWASASVRYSLPFLAPASVLLAAGIQAVSTGRRGGRAAAAAVIAAMGLRGILAVRGGSPGLPARFWPRTVAWLKDEVPEGGVLQSLRASPLALLTGRRCLQPPLRGDRDLWLAVTIGSGVGWIVDRPGEEPGGYSTAGLRREARSLSDWARKSRYASEAFHDPVEGTVVYRFEHPDPGRFGEAWRLLQSVDLSKPEESRRDLKRAAALEPEFELPGLILNRL